MFQPAPPSCRTSTDPPQLWADTSPEPTLTLSGKHVTHTYDFPISVPRNKAFIFVFLPVPPPQERVCGGSVQADVCPAGGAAGGAEELHSERGGGAERAQAVSLRPGSRRRRVGGH